MILDAAYLHVDRIPVESDLVAQLRSLQAEGVEIPCAWSLTSGPDDPGSPGRVTLDFGLNGDVGMVQWIDADRHLVPAMGSNPRWSVYYLGGTYDTPVPPYAEVSLETVCSVVAEFLRTRVLPTVVEWQEAAPIESMFDSILD
ncbi:hypothetical protein [Alloactinosynnema sp. L-07]|uniref:Imm1 family immunity protein n=1 Tax=Alloactinosynnema sp. L-07 TaxID=1653480 RepID=UPI00065F09FE|nr:Imm1 family immunity protein [Alloactinosynnema sp. L-07]CRK59581.1 hypothetical protein [Alloactinosynnema sp. L-07]